MLLLLFETELFVFTRERLLFLCGFNTRHDVFSVEQSL